MKRLIPIFSIALFLGCTEDISETKIPADENGIEYAFSAEDVVGGMVRIKLKEEPADEVVVRSGRGAVVTGIDILDGTASVIGITRMQRTFPHAGRFEERTRREGLHLWYDVWFSADIASTRAAGNVAVIEGIEIAVPVVKVRSLAMEPESHYFTNTLARNVVYPFNDPDLELQWAYNNPGTEAWQEAGADIRLFDVWKQYNGHPDIIVSIVDGGIEPMHPDLIDNLWVNPGEVDGNGVDDDGNGYIDDVYGYNFVTDSPVITGHRHGTHVAGTVGAVNNNGIGVSGIAGGDGTPGSGVKLMNCQIFEHLYGNPSYGDVVADNIGAAIKYGADNGAVISQNSWGYAVDESARSSYIDPSHKAAIDYFVKYAGCDNNGDQLPGSPMKGGIVLFASGNADTSNPRTAAPADYEKVLGIAAIGPDYKKGSYSNYGDYTALSAPGGTSAHGIYSTTVAAAPFGYYEARYGTSMSCPHVAGVAALVIQKHGVGKQGFTAAQLEEILMSSAYDLDAYNPEYVGLLGAGGVDASAALGAKVPEPDEERFVLVSNIVKEGKLYFRVSKELAGTAIIRIYNGTGYKVLDRQIETQRHVTAWIDVSNLATGPYTLEYRCNGSSVKEKFMKY